MSIHSEKTVQKARKLRERHLSYKEIGKKLGIPSSTVRRWCFGIKAGKGISLLEIQRNKRIRREIIGEERNFLENFDIKKIDKHQAKLLACILYWCEGSKYPGETRMCFTSSDEGMMKVFIFLLRRGFKIDEEKFRVHLQIHKTQDFENLRKYWSELLGIAKTQFIKPTVTMPTGNRHRRGYKGTCTLRYNDYRILLKLTAFYGKLSLMVDYKLGGVA